MNDFDPLLMMPTDNFDGGPSGDGLLLEDSGWLLLEDGEYLLLE